MLLGLTKEYLICGALVILCVLLFTIIVKDKLNQRSGQMQRYSFSQYDSATSQPYGKPLYYTRRCTMVTEQLSKFPLNVHIAEMEQRYGQSLFAILRILVN